MNENHEQEMFALVWSVFKQIVDSYYFDVF